MGLRPTNTHESPQPVIPSEAPHRTVQGEARNLLLFVSEKQQMLRSALHDRCLFQQPATY